MELRNIEVEMDPFDKSFQKEYELAKRVGDARFGSECEHKVVRNGKCVSCCRKVR